MITIDPNQPVNELIFTKDKASHNRKFAERSVANCPLHTLPQITPKKRGYIAIFFS